MFAMGGTLARLDHPVSADPEEWATQALRCQAMPWHEVRAVLRTDDPLLLHRYLELHRERLEERLLEEGEALDRLERVLSERIVARRERRDGSSAGRRATA